MNKIAELRKNRNISQTELAKYLGVTRQAISLYEKWPKKGSREPGIATWKKLADYFDVPINLLIGSQKSIPATQDTDMLTDMDWSPDMMEQSKTLYSQKTAVAFNRVLFWLDNDVLDENTSKPTKSEEVRQKEKELITILKNTFEYMQDDFLGGINFTISEPQKYIEGIDYYNRNFIMMKEFNKLNEDDKMEIMLSIKKLRQKELEQNKKASED